MYLNGNEWAKRQAAKHGIAFKPMDNAFAECENEVLRRSLAGETLVGATDAFEIVRSLLHGHVAAALGVLRDLDLERLICRERCRERDLGRRDGRPAAACAVLEAVNDTACAAVNACAGA
ncbi:MAG: hypothetical protein ACLP22_16620 [Solirubrobacteraceae bacterium]